MNRYSNYTPSAYSPMSFEEIAMVPMMKRKKHDEILAQQELVRAGLAKVDPYDKHFNEAIKIKQELESKMDKTALELSQKGINNDMIGKTIALNREYQNETAPTGRLGQINAEKQNILKINDEYDKYGQQKGWSEAETNYWKQQALSEYNKKSVYDDNGRILKYSGPKEIANKLDYNKRLHDLATSAGMTSEEFKEGLPIAVGQDASGYFTQGHQMKGWSTAKNRPQVTKAYETLIAELNDPTSELRKSADYERRDLTSLQGILNTQKEIYMKDSRSDEYDYKIDHFGSGPATTENANFGAFGEDYNSSEVGGNAQDYSEVERIGRKESSFAIGSSPSVAGSGTGGYSYGKDYKGTTFKSSDIKDPKQKALYDNMYKKLTTVGVIGLDGKRHFIKADYVKKGKDDPETAKQVLNMLKQVPAITLTSKMLTTDTELNNSGFSASIGKTADDRDKQMRKQLKLTNSGARKLIDPETGKTISFAEAKEKYNLKGADNVNYHGYVSPLNWEEHTFNGTNSKASPHVITAEDEKGNFVEFKTSRLNSDNVGVNVDRYNDLNINYRNWSINHNEFNNFESKSPNLSKLKVKYNTMNPKVDPQRGVLDMEVMDKDGVVRHMTQAEFVNTVNATR